MSQQDINVGSAPDAGDGDPIRTAWVKANSNFDELYGTLGTLGSVALLSTNGTDSTFLNGTGGWSTPSAGATAWGQITGTYTDQTDLSNALTAKLGTGVPSTTGYALMTATSATAGRSAISAGTSNFDGAYASLSGKPTLSAVATSGTYADLLNKPVLAVVATSGVYADLTSKPSLFSGTYADLANIPSTFAPATHTHTYNQIAGTPSLAAVATSGTYADLLGKPTLGSIVTVNTSGTAATFLNGTGGWTVPPGTATGGGGGGTTIRFGLVSAISTGTGTGYANVTGLSCGISPSETMQIRAYLMGGCSGTGGSRLTMTVPTGATANFYVAGNGASATAYTQAVCTTGGQDPNVTFWNANSTVRFCEIHGVVVNGTTSGTVQIQRRSVVATFVTTVSVGSHLTGMVSS